MSELQQDWIARWQKIARRIRVPLGFLAAALYLFSLWQNAPRPAAVAWSLALVLPGLWLRAYASGYVKKNQELTVTGPYAHTRNPLYLGSVLIAAGFAVALLSWPVAVVMAIGFAIIYIPVIASEERFLRATFPRFDEYCRRVPRLIPRPTPARFGGNGGEQPVAGNFSLDLYLRHREYNAAIGAALLYLSLLFYGLFWKRSHLGCGERFRVKIVKQNKEPRPKLKTRRYAIAFLCAFVLASVAHGQLAAPQPNFPFPQKQTLTYSVDWRVFPTGTAVLHFESIGDRVRLTANADTSGAINLLFHVSDRFQSTFDRQKGCTEEFDKQTVEGRRQINSTLRIDYSQNKSILDEKNQVTGQTKHVETPVSGCVTDLLTGMFYAASQPLTPGRSFTFPVVDAQKTVPVTMRVESREEIKTPLGTFKTVRVQPTADAGVVKNRGNIWIWYTDDERHLPVQMRARLFWGTITFRLTGNENK